MITAVTFKIEREREKEKEIREWIDLWHAIRRKKRERERKHAVAKREKRTYRTPACCIRPGRCLLLLLFPSYPLQGDRLSLVGSTAC